MEGPRVPFTDTQTFTWWLNSVVIPPDDNPTYDLRTGGQISARKTPTSDGRASISRSIIARFPVTDQRAGCFTFAGGHRHHPRSPLRAGQPTDGPTSESGGHENPRGLNFRSGPIRRHFAFAGGCDNSCADRATTSARRIAKTMCNGKVFTRANEEQTTHILASSCGLHIGQTRHVSGETVPRSRHMSSCGQIPM